MIEVDYLTCLDFFLEHKGFREGLTFTDKGKYFIAKADGKKVGMCSTFQIGKWLRIKSLFVPRKFRGKGIATYLISRLSENRNCTAFSFDSSKEIFIKCGFVNESTGKNGVHFMRKTV